MNNQPIGNCIGIGCGKPILAADDHYVLTLSSIDNPDLRITAVCHAECKVTRKLQYGTA
jgi:hypothetical protein